MGLGDIGGAVKGGLNKAKDGVGKLADGGIDTFKDITPDPVEDRLEGLAERGGTAFRKGTDAAAGQLDDWGLHKAAGLTRRFGEGVNNHTGGDVPERDLEETESAKDLIHGSPSKLRSTARHLKDFAKAFNGVGRGLRRLDSRHLKGAAAEAFREKAQVQPARWSKAADACERAAGALEDFAGTVEWARGQAGECVRAYKEGKAASAAHGRAVTFYNDAVDAYNDLPAKDRKPGSLPDRPPAEDPGAAAMREARETLEEARRQRDAAARAAKGAVEAARDAAPPKPSYAAQLKSGGKGWLLNAEHQV
ncbi:S46 family peptidase, partial [Streptomyces boncukensis]|nr:S46 family peptidase [Streptomyces boncukensis]